MVLALVAILIGAAVGVASGGNSNQLSTFRPTAWWLVPLSAVIYALAIVDDGGLGEPVLAALSLTALVAFAVVNLSTPGMAVVAIGLGLNLVPLMLNGATVISNDLAEHVGLDTDRDLGVARRLEVADDRAVFLGDAMSLPIIKWLVSFGDLIVLAGMANVGYRLTYRRDHDDSIDVRTGDDAASATDEISDPWIALVRGDIDEAAYGEATGEIRPAFGSPTPTTGIMRLNDSGETSLPWLQDAPTTRPPASQSSPTTVPVMPSAEDDLDLSLVRWGDDTTPSSRADPPRSDHDTGEMDLRQLQELLGTTDGTDRDPPAETTFAPPPDLRDPAPPPPPAPEPESAPNDAAGERVETATAPAPTPAPAPAPAPDVVEEPAVADRDEAAAPTPPPANDHVDGGPGRTSSEAPSASNDVEVPPPDADATPPATATGPIQLGLLDDGSAPPDADAQSSFDELLARFDDNHRNSST